MAAEAEAEAEVVVPEEQAEGPAMQLLVEQGALVELVDLQASGSTSGSGISGTNATGNPAISTSNGINGNNNGIGSNNGTNANGVYARLRWNEYAGDQQF